VTGNRNFTVSVTDRRSESTKLVGCEERGGTGPVWHYLSVGCCKRSRHATVWNIARQLSWLLQLRSVHVDHVWLHSGSWKQPWPCAGNDKNMTATTTTSIFSFGYIPRRFTCPRQ